MRQGRLYKSVNLFSTFLFRSSTINHGTTFSTDVTSRTGPRQSLLESLFHYEFDSESTAPQSAHVYTLCRKVRSPYRLTSVRVRTLQTSRLLPGSPSSYHLRLLRGPGSSMPQNIRGKSHRDQENVKRPFGDLPKFVLSLSDAKGFETSDLLPKCILSLLFLSH